MDIYKKKDLYEKQVLLYGAGNLGRKLYECFKKNGVFISGFIDQNAGELQAKWLNVPVWYPESDILNYYTNDGLVILAGLFGCTQENAICKKIYDIGFSSVCSLREIDWNSLSADEFLSALFIGDFSPSLPKDNYISISKVKKLFSNEEQKFMQSYIEAHIKKDYTLFPQPLPLEDQYLGLGIDDMILNADVFVDAGAYNGDVLHRFLHANKKVRYYIAFEPQQKLCHEIYNTIVEGNINKGIVYPCGLSECWETIKFSLNVEGMSASKADESGEGIIQCLPLDETLHGIIPTFIKMDIEGMELKALRGAANTIKKYHPQLAICVYHELTHLWEIPLYIQSLYPEYKFALRNYQYMGLETVVYAYV